MKRFLEDRPPPRFSELLLEFYKNFTHPAASFWSFVSGRESWKELLTFVESNTMNYRKIDFRVALEDCTGGIAPTFFFFFMVFEFCSVN